MEKKIIKNFEITGWRHHPCPMGTIDVPETFKAEIEYATNTTLEEIVKEIKSELVGRKKNENKGWNWYWSAWSGDYVRIPHNNIATEEKGKDGFMGFVLTAETYGSTTAIKEGIYGIKKEGTKLVGKLISYDYTYFRGSDNHNYFRYMVGEIKNGILKYKIIRKGYEYEGEYDLNKLK
jgi:hypothetical protein